MQLLRPGPGRQQRPKRLAMLLRGLPGSGKSHVAKLMREKEVEAGGEPPRILSLDDYFMTEVEREVDEGDEGGRRGRKRKIEVLEYCYEPEMEATYQRSLLKAFQRAVEEARYKFIIVDAPALKVADFKDFWSAGQAAGYEVYVAEPAETDPQVCFERNAHGRSKEDVYRLSAEWEPTPAVYTLLLLDGLLGRGGGSAATGSGSDSIAEVEMGQDEDEEEQAGAGGGGSPAQGSDSEGEEPSRRARPAAASRWAALEDGSEGERPGAAGKKRKKQSSSKSGAGGADGLAVDDWRELLAGGKQQLAAKAAAGAGAAGGKGSGTPRGILSKGSGGSASKKRVRWPDEERGSGGEEEAQEAEPGFRIAGGKTGTTAKSGLEVVHVLHGLGPPSQLEDGSAGVAPHPGSKQQGADKFAAAARAEHHTEADAFRHLLLSRGGA